MSDPVAARVLGARIEGREKPSASYTGEDREVSVTKSALVSGSCVDSMSAAMSAAARGTDPANQAEYKAEGAELGAVCKKWSKSSISPKLDDSRVRDTPSIARNVDTGVCTLQGSLIKDDGGDCAGQPGGEGAKDSLTNFKKNTKCCVTSVTDSVVGPVGAPEDSSEEWTLVAATMLESGRSVTQFERFDAADTWVIVEPEGLCCSIVGRLDLGFETVVTRSSSSRVKRDATGTIAGGTSFKGHSLGDRAGRLGHDPKGPKGAMHHRMSLFAVPSAAISRVRVALWFHARFTTQPVLRLPQPFCPGVPRYPMGSSEPTPSQKGSSFIVYTRRVIWPTSIDSVVELKLEGDARRFWRVNAEGTRHALQYCTLSGIVMLTDIAQVWESTYGVESEELVPGFVVDREVPLSAIPAVFRPALGLVFAALQEWGAMPDRGRLGFELPRGGSIMGTFDSSVPCKLDWCTSPQAHILARGLDSIHSRSVARTHGAAEAEVVHWCPSGTFTVTPRNTVEVLLHDSGVFGVYRNEGLQLWSKSALHPSEPDVVIAEVALTFKIPDKESRVSIWPVPTSMLRLACSVSRSVLATRAHHKEVPTVPFPSEPSLGPEHSEHIDGIGLFSRSASGIVRATYEDGTIVRLQQPPSVVSRGSLIGAVPAVAERIVLTAQWSRECRVIDRRGIEYRDTAAAICDVVSSLEPYIKQAIDYDLSLA